MYAGDLDSSQAWARLEADPSAALVDVRTAAEWTFVGIPDLSALGRKPVFVEWQSYPSMTVDPAFVNRLSGDIGETDKDRAIFFLCRSGGRSRSAAQAMTSAGYARCFNISDGFEGPVDQDGHRGTTAGWKANNLPWTQG